MGGWERSIENTKIGQRQPRAGKFTVLETDTFETTGNMIVGGDLHVTGSMIVTAFVLHEGSNIFGDAATDTHKFIGITTASGDLTVNTDLHVKTNASFDSDLTVAGNENLTGSLFVNGNASIDGTTKLGGKTTLFGITHAKTTASLDSNLNVAGDTRLTGSLLVDKNASVDGILKVGGKSVLYGILHSKTTASLDSDLNIAGDASITGSLLLDKNASIDGTLAVGGVTTLEGVLHGKVNASLDSNLIVAGNIKGNMDEIIQATSDTLTAAEVRGTIISNYGQGAADNLQTLPTAAEGMNFIGVCGTAQAANYFRFQAGATDKIYLNGVAGADNGSVSIAVPVVGSSIVFYTFQTGAGVYDWGAITVSGLWTAV